MKTLIISLLLCLLMVASANATVPASETIRQPFTCNGSTTEFTFTMPCYSSSDVYVYTHIIATGVEALLTESSQYTIAATDSDYLNGGVVTTTSTYASTYRIVIVRNIQKTQELLRAQMSAAAAIEAVDKLTRIVQDLEDRFERSIHLQESDGTFDMELPGLALRAGMYYYFGDDGAPSLIASVVSDNTVVSGFMETVVDDATGRAGLTTLGGIPVVNVQTYGAVADGDGAGGGTENAAAFQSAITAAAEGTLVIPSGTYRLDSALTTTEELIIQGQGGAILDFSNLSGSDIAIKLDGASGNYLDARTVIRDIILVGPESGSPQDGSPSTTTIGIYSEYVLGLLMENVEIQRFKTAMFATYTWPINMQACKLHINYVGLQLDSTNTTGTYLGCRILSNYTNLYFKGQSLNQSFISCDFEDSKWNSIVFDPDGSSISGITFLNPYFEEIGTVGTPKDCFAFRQTIAGADSSGTVNNIFIQGGTFNDTIMGYHIDNQFGGTFGFTLMGLPNLEDISADINGDLRMSTLTTGDPSLTEGMWHWDKSSVRRRFAFSSGTSQTSTVVIDSDATPSVADADTNVFLATNDNLDITDFDDGVNGQIIYLIATGTTTTTVKHDATKINLAGGADWVGDPTYRDTLSLEYNGTDWNELSRSGFEGGTHTITVELSSAKVLDLADTPITLVAAQGTGTLVEFVSAILIHDAGTAYAEPSAPDDLVIEYENGDDVSQEIDSTGFLDQTVDEVRMVNSLVPSADPTTTDLEGNKNDALRLFNTGTDLTTGTGTMTVKITYRVHVLGL